MLANFLRRPPEPPSAYDRSQTVGASEIGECARMVWFGKSGADPDLEYVDGDGFRDRGHAMERWAIERMLENGADLKHTVVDGQLTLVDGFISGTPDGLYAGKWSLDVKSFDPRKSRFPEPPHVMQVKVAANLWKLPKIEGSVLCYINASDYADVREFVFPIDPQALVTAKDRARMIMAAEKHTDLPAEGWIAQECGLCPFVRQCIGKKPEDGKLPDEQLAQLAELDKLARAAKVEALAATERERAAKLDIMNFLRAAKVRRVPGVARVTVTDGRQTLDTEAMEKAGIDLSLYRKAGRPSESVTLE